MKRWPAVEIVWHDAHGGDEGWLPIKHKHTKPASIRSVGMLAKESDTCVVLVLSHDLEAKASAAYISILKVNIVSRREID
jgi:hypothetical protein